MVVAKEAVEVSRFGLGQQDILWLKGGSGGGGGVRRLDVEGRSTGASYLGAMGDMI